MKSQISGVRKRNEGKKEHTHHIIFDRFLNRINVITNALKYLKPKLEWRKKQTKKKPTKSNEKPDSTQTHTIKTTQIQKFFHILHRILVDICSTLTVCSMQHALERVSNILNVFFFLFLWNSLLEGGNTTANFCCYYFNFFSFFIFWLFRCLVSDLIRFVTISFEKEWEKESKRWNFMRNKF